MTCGFTLQRKEGNSSDLTLQDTGLPTKDETVKTTLNSLNMSCTEYSLVIGYTII